MGISSFVVSLVINIVAGTALFLLFCFLRTRMRWLYEPRSFLHLDAKAPPKLSSGFFSWIWPLLTTSEETLAQCSGIDAVMNLRFLQFAFKLFLFACLFGLIILVPVNATAAEGLAEGLDILSLANIPTGSARVAAHIISAYLFSFAAFYLLYKDCRQFVSLRVRYLQQEQPENLSVLVKDMPEEYADVNLIATYFSRSVPGCTCRVTIVNDLYKADALVKEREDLLHRMERAQVAFEEKQAKMNSSEKTLLASKQPQARPKACVRCRRVDAIEHYTNRITQLNHDVAAELAKNPRRLPRAFVTFDTRANAYEARRPRANLSTVDRSWDWSVTHACEPRDVIWSNMYRSSAQLFLRFAVAWAVTIVLVIFYIIPATFVASLVSLSNLVRLLPFLEPVVNFSPTLRGLIQGYLPALILAIFNAILPYVIWWITKFQAIHSRSAEQFSLFTKLFAFQIVNIFFAVIVAGSIFDALEDRKSVV